MIQIFLQTLDGKKRLSAKLPEIDERFVVDVLPKLKQRQSYAVRVVSRDGQLIKNPYFGDTVTKGEMIIWLSKHVFGGTLTTHLYNDLRKVYKC